MSNLESPAPDSLSRRALLRTSAAVAGGCAASLVPLPVAALSPQEAARDGVFDVKAFGAGGLRGQNATGACQAAIDACAAAGGGVVRVPPGEYSVGTIQLKDNVTLHVEAGATLFLIQDNAMFPRGRRAMVFAENAVNIGVTGRGTLDGLAQYEFVAMRGVDPEIANEIAIARAAGVDMRRYYRVGVQAYMFILNNCRNVLLRDISIVHSPLWSVRLNDCDRVHVRGVFIASDLEKGVNADGIDIVSSRNVTIADSIIETADDAIVLKAIARDGQPARPTENVTVTNCVLTSSSTALMIGTETEADIRHVLFNNCVIRNSNKGFGINVQDGATVSDVIVSNLTIETGRRHWNWWGSAEMCKLVLKKRTPASRLGAIRDIVVDNVIARPRGTSTITGHAERPIENVRLSNIEVTMLPENAVDKRATHALQLEHVRGARVRDLSVRWTEDAAEPNWQSALVLRRVSAFDIAGFTGRQGLRGGNHPALLLDESQDGTIRNARAIDGCRRLIHVQGESTRNLAVSGSEVPAGVPAVSFATPGLKRAVRVT
ncbi:MAG TPA: glycosyl hydrolase family 28 protein [Vicinamibacterales bacterium]|nr:glycosyl hydrolase family 28 protein [Vicinamibacterales bacterium]